MTKTLNLRVLNEGAENEWCDATALIHAVNHTATGVSILENAKRVPVILALRKAYEDKASAVTFDRLDFQVLIKCFREALFPVSIRLDELRKDLEALEKEGE